MSIQYLIDYHYENDEEALIGTSLHLLTFNPGERDAALTLTVYHEDREPDVVSIVAAAGKSSNHASWSAKPDERFALKVESSEPVVCQCTVAWNNSLNQYAPDAKTKDPHGLRECAWTYTAIKELAKDWFIADCIVIDQPETMYVSESEWVAVLNPGDQLAEVTLAMHYGDGEVGEYSFEVPARRLKVVCVDNIARRNTHYGLHCKSDQPVAVQSARSFHWLDRPDLMCYWSVPCVPGPLN